MRIPEITWKQGRIIPHEHINIGDEIKVHILAATNKKFSASIKRVDPDDDPWIYPPKLGSQFNAKVYAVVDYGFWLIVPTNIFGILLNKHAICKHSIGGEVAIEIIEVNSNKNVHVKELKKGYNNHLNEDVA